MKQIFKRLMIALAAIFFFYFASVSISYGVNHDPQSMVLAFLVPCAAFGFYRLALWVATGERLFTFRFASKPPAPKMSPCKIASFYAKR